MIRKFPSPDGELVGLDIWLDIPPEESLARLASFRPLTGNW
ncbi:hypothetical protein AmaxDRAFT_5341 [Limnospira maxima CS-328]|uniref:Uncharacterized protein n=1 Tax=Limnospira maxima CS-328 TaxID=513049 RepID=B5W991_LIMMA|nr:hypothetical protein AmaxDRAFT_5341 [Limnospira maxima CS-328]